MFRYAITEKIAAWKAREEISARLLLLPTTHQQQQESSSLRLVSMRESFDLELLTQFYNELMIPNFPLEEERDDLDDWVYYLDPANKVMKQQNNQQPYPSMDVLLLVKTEQQQQAVEVEEKSAATTRRTTIVAGVAFEYYRQAQCGLLSYVVVPDEFRRLGIMRSLHPVACQAMQLLHEESLSATEVNNNNNNHHHHHATAATTTTIKAIFAETNTVEADDAPPAIIRKRHEI